MKCPKCSAFYYFKEACPLCGCFPSDNKIVFDPAILNLSMIKEAFKRHGYFIKKAELNNIPVLSLRHKNKDIPDILIGFLKESSFEVDLIIALVIPTVKIECIQTYLDQLNKINSIISPFKFVINSPQELISLAIFPMFSRVFSSSLVNKVETEVNRVCQSISSNLSDYVLS